MREQGEGKREGFSDALTRKIALRSRVYDFIGLCAGTVGDLFEGAAAAVKKVGRVGDLETSVSGKSVNAAWKDRGCKSCRWRGREMTKLYRCRCSCC